MNPFVLKARAFINKEKMYVFMLCFIVLVNVFAAFAPEMPEPKEKLLAQEHLDKEETKSELGYEALKDRRMLWKESLAEKRHILIYMSLLGWVMLLAFFLGIFLDVRIVMAGIKKRRLFKKTGRHIKVKWAVLDIFKLVVIFVFLGYILHFIEVYIGSMRGEANRLYFISLLNTAVMDLAILGVIIYFVRVKYRQSLSSLGLRIKNLGKNIFLAVSGYIAFLPVLAVLLLLLIIISKLFSYDPPQHALFKLFFQEESLLILICSTAIVVVLGPIVEEVFFRGFTYNAIKRKWGVKSAIAVTSIVFAALHGTLFGFVPILLLGFLLAYMYEKTGSLIPSITIHMLHNGLMMLFLFLGRYFTKTLGSF